MSSNRGIGSAQVLIQKQLSILAEKELGEYQTAHAPLFPRIFRALKPGRWMTVEFSNTQACLECDSNHDAGGGFRRRQCCGTRQAAASFRCRHHHDRRQTRPCYSGLQAQRRLGGSLRKTRRTEEGVWDFMRTHLNNLPVVKATGGRTGIHRRARPAHPLRPHGGLLRRPFVARAAQFRRVSSRAGREIPRARRHVLPARAGQRIRQEARTDGEHRPD